MSETKPPAAASPETRARFAELVGSIRPDLHRYCARMMGSVLDGEDVVQETLAQGAEGLSTLAEDAELRPWLFKIAHNRCVDVLRSRRTWATTDVDDEGEGSMAIDAEIEDHELAARAFSLVVLALPPRERASIVLKDVLGYSLPEIARILDTSVGGVKAALHRGREKVAALQEAQPGPREPLPPAAERYLEAFNRRDWGAVGSLLEEDVRCELVAFATLVGRKALEERYFANYAGRPFEWRFAATVIDGRTEIACLRLEGGRWKAWNAVRLEWHGGRIRRIRDYAHVDYLLDEARIDLDGPT